MEFENLDIKKDRLLFNRSFQQEFEQQQECNPSVALVQISVLLCGPCWNRTNHHLIMSQVL
jgi:hypothetical protein